MSDLEPGYRESDVEVKAPLQGSGASSDPVSSTAGSRIYVYGQAPARDQADPTLPPFSGGRNGLLFEQLAGVPIVELRQRWTFRNVLRYYPGRAPDGADLFPAKEARTAALAEMTEWRHGDSVLFCGRAVAEAFDFDAPWFWWLPFGRVRAAVMPHPSGLNRLWNSPSIRREASLFLRDLAGTW